MTVWRPGVSPILCPACLLMAAVHWMYVLVVDMLSFLPSSARRCSIRSMNTRFPQDITRWPRAMMVLWNTQSTTGKDTNSFLKAQKHKSQSGWTDLSDGQPGGGELRQKAAEDGGVEIHQQTPLSANKDTEKNSKLHPSPPAPSIGDRLTTYLQSMSAMMSSASSCTDTSSCLAIALVKRPVIFLQTLAAKAEPETEAGGEKMNLHIFTAKPSEDSWNHWMLKIFTFYRSKLARSEVILNEICAVMRSVLVKYFTTGGRR